MITGVFILFILWVIHLVFSYLSSIFKEKALIYKDVRKLNTTEVSGIVYYDNTLKEYLASKHMNRWYDKVRAIN